MEDSTVDAGDTEHQVFTSSRSLVSIASYKLKHIKLYNWGPFHQAHCVEIDENGTAIIGKTGSGKTTIVDAFMTLICPKPKYNLASTGGHESDRDLVSYVRGVTGAGTRNSNDHISRQGKTKTALEAIFSNGKETIRIGALMWFDGTSNATDDLGRLWIFSRNNDCTVEDLLTELKESGKRGVKTVERNTDGLFVTETKKAYLARLNRFFQVNNNAFVLLNRAAGLKQINSIDELFRELVLEDRSAFDRAGEVVTEFDDLATIHEELQIAKEQRDSLLPVRDEFTRYQTKQQQLEIQLSIQIILPTWFALKGNEIWKSRVTELERNLQITDLEIETLSEQITEQETQTEALRDLYMDNGGASVEHLEKELARCNLEHSRLMNNAKDYQQIAKELGLDTTLIASQLVKNQSIASSQLEMIGEQLQHKQESEYRHVATKQNLEEQLEDLLKEVKRIEGSESNIEGRFLEYQYDLAKVLELETYDVPFLAELIQVKSDQQAWRGAIERAIGQNRLRLLVPSNKIHQALAWINNRDNKLHVRLLRVDQADNSLAHFKADGFTRKLNFKKHPYREAVKQLLASIDRHCVDDIKTLNKTPHSLTKEGTMSGKVGFFDKQDNRRLDQDWMTGFDNEDRKAQLANEISSVQQDLTQSSENFQTAKRERLQIEWRIQQYNKIKEQNFDEINVSDSAQKLTNIEEKLNSIKDPNSDTANAEKDWKSAKNKLEQIRKSNDQLVEKYGVQKNELRMAHETKNDYFNRIGKGLTDEQMSKGHQYFASLDLNSNTIDSIERQQTEALRQKIDTIKEGINAIENTLTRNMERAKKQDTGALTESGSELEDVPAYLERLRILIEEGLPEKQAQFLQYLNESSDQGVTQLLMTIQNEVDKVKEKIEELNLTMCMVDYQPGRYLQLKPINVTHDILNRLNRAQQKLRYNSTLDDEGESHYQALKNLVDILRDATEKKRTKEAQALLDPRFRLEFSIEVIDRNDVVKQN